MYTFTFTTWLLLLIPMPLTVFLSAISYIRELRRKRLKNHG